MVKVRGAPRTVKRLSGKARPSETARPVAKGDFATGFSVRRPRGVAALAGRLDIGRAAHRELNTRDRASYSRRVAAYALPPANEHEDVP